MSEVSIILTKSGEITWEDWPEWEVGDNPEYGVELMRIEHERTVWWHDCKKSALYDDMSGYKDEPRARDYELDADMLYIVTYYEYLDDLFGLAHKVDFGITKDQIIQNIQAQKYVEGANYYPMRNTVMFNSIG